MRKLYWHLILSVIWMFMRNDFTLTGLLTGFGLSFVALGLSEKVNPRPGTSSHMRDLIKISALFFLSVLRANISLARDILWSRTKFTHAFFRVDCRDLSPAQTVLLGNMISLTPGSLTLDADKNGHGLYVHTLYGEDVDKIRTEIGTFLSRMSKLKSTQSDQASEGRP